MKQLFFLLLIYIPLVAEISYNKDIRPILSDKCLGCHGPDAHEAKGGLQLHTFEAATKSLGKSKDRQAIVPGDLGKSELWYRIMTDDEEDAMPPIESHKSLSDKEKELLKAWIESGAEYDEHWSFKALSEQEIPKVKNSSWVNNEIDHFILEKIESSKLKVSAPAEPSLLIRRLYLDLTGLPAPLDVMDKFSEKPGLKHYEAIVDSLLNSPQYAERMALDWMDAARYADTNGYSIDDHRDMWAWRDWVIHAFASNKPYDQFILEQVAGDLIPEASVQQKIATGFLRNSMSTHEGGTIAEEYRVAYTKDKVDVVSTAIMGMTMKCAQCHDHKYDPISMKEYYQFYAYFNSSSEGGRGGVNGNIKPLIESDSVYCDETQLKAEMEQRILALEKTMMDSIPNFEDKRKRWVESVINKVTHAQQATKNANIYKAGIKPKQNKLSWIWSEKPVVQEKIEFTKSFFLEQIPSSAFLKSTCDNAATVFINNKEIGEIKDWNKPLEKDIAKRLKRGENKILVKARNAGGSAGFIFDLSIKSDSNKMMIQSDSSWNVKIPGLKELRAAVVLASYGAKPWGDVFSDISKYKELYALLLKGFDSLSFAEREKVYEKMLKDLNLESVFVKTLKKEIEVLKNVKAKGKVSTMIMDHKDRQTFVLARGAYDQPGEEVKPGLPAFLPKPTEEESVPNRLGLAKWLIRKDHPLTSRVMVNRLWQMIMGRGLVETSEDFGSQGSMPVQEKLLNYLSYDFVDHQWDVKRLVKKIVTSATYAQSSKATGLQKELDPRNEWFSRAPRFRLTAELIRDNTLVHAGLLNPKIGGPSVYPDQPDNLWREISHYGYPRPFTAQIFIPSQGKDLYRRSLYTFWKRTMNPPNMTIFDAPTRETCTVRRLTTNTPLQALVLMNDPQFFHSAQEFGRGMYENKLGLTQKLNRAYYQVTGRQISSKDSLVLKQAFQSYLKHYEQNPQAAKEVLAKEWPIQKIEEQAAYTMLASTLLNLDEAITRQ